MTVPPNRPLTTNVLIPLPEQRLARSSLDRMRKPASAKGRLLFLTGAAGCGKSALLAEFAQQRPGVLVLTATEFAARLADASANDQLAEFQEQFRSPSVFVCEDVHAIAGRTQTLQQLLSLVDDLLAHGQDVIVSSTKLPGQLEDFPSKLINRFRGGTLVAVKPPGSDSRAALLREIATRERVSIARDALALLAESLDVSPRELCGLLQQLVARTESVRTSNAGSSKSLEPKELTSRRIIKRSDVESFLEDPAIRPQPAIRLLDVSRAVAAEFGVTTAAIRSVRRSASLVLPRQCAMWLCRKLCSASYPQLGEFFERQHSSVLHAIRRLESRLKDDPQLRQRMNRVELAVKRRPT